MIGGDQFVLADEPDRERSGQLGDTENPAGVEDARAAGEYDAGGFEALHEQLRDLVGEQLRVGGGCFQPQECPNDGNGFGTRVVRTDEGAARRARALDYTPLGYSGGVMDVRTPG